MSVHFSVFTVFSKIRHLRDDLLVINFIWLIRCVPFNRNDIKSLWLKSSNQRRKAKSAVNLRLQQYFDEPGQYADPVESGNRLPNLVKQGAECGDQIDDEEHRSQDSDEVDFMDAECTAAAYPETVGDFENGVESDDDDIEQPTLTTSLKNWAVEYGITLVALTALLSVLRHHHPNPNLCFLLDYFFYV